MLRTITALVLFCFCGSAYATPDPATIALEAMGEWNSGSPSAESFACGYESSHELGIYYLGYSATLYRVGQCCSDYGVNFTFPDPSLYQFRVHVTSDCGHDYYDYSIYVGVPAGDNCECTFTFTLERRFTLDVDPTWETIPSAGGALGFVIKCDDINCEDPHAQKEASNE